MNWLIPMLLFFCCCFFQYNKANSNHCDPFYEAQENHNLIGVANIFLECLFHDVKLQYAVPIISQQGEVTEHQDTKINTQLNYSWGSLPIHLLH